MAWTSPRTWAADELVTAALLNEQVRDNLSFLYNAPGARVYNSAHVSVGASHVLSFDSERYDTDNIHSTVTNSSRLTCHTAGKYIVIGSIQLSPSSVGYRGLSIRLNGTTMINNIRIPSLGASDYPLYTVTALYPLNVGDYVELVIDQNSGGSLTCYAVGNYSPEFVMQWIGA